MATKPNLSQYFFFLVKSQDRLDKKTANEAQGFWDSLCEIYNLTGPLPEIVNSLEELVSDDLTGTPLQYFGSKDNADGSVNALQLFSNGVLIFLITISKPPSYVTDTPEADWEQQLEIQVTARDLKNVLGTASLLHTKSEQFQNLLMTVRTKIPFAKGQNIHYCTFDFGRFIIY
jgi:hypothetical protein